MHKLDKILVYIKYFLLSKFGYFLIIILFAVWLGFFDDNNLMKKYKLKIENRDINKENAEYRKRIKDHERKIENFVNHQDDLERYARENYGMKAKDEVVFIFDE